MNLKDRNISYDIIRVIALLMIVMVHISAYIVTVFPGTSEAEWFVGNLFNGLSRAGVPMFIMLSGALLLNEDKPIKTKQFYKNSLLPISLLTISWIVAYGLFYAVVLPALKGNPISVSDFLYYILFFKGSDYTHLWYMLMVMGMYLAIPVLRLFVKRENKPYITGIIIASLIFQFGSATADFLTANSYWNLSDLFAKFHMQPVTGFLGLVLLGWYLNEYTLKAKTRYILYIAGIVAVSASTLTVYSTIDTIPDIRNYMYEANTLPAFVYAAALFVFIQSFCRKNTDGSKLLATLSGCTFGMYLVHVIVLEVFVQLILPYKKFGIENPLAYIMILYVIVLIISFVVVYLTGKIKGLRKIFFK